jgi:hypothetical protein
MAISLRWMDGAGAKFSRAMTAADDGAAASASGGGNAGMAAVLVAIHATAEGSDSCVIM